MTARTCFVGREPDRLAVADFLVGDGGENRLVGLAGSDFLIGQLGNDTLVDGGTSPYDINQFIGGPGSDIYYGGATKDVANFGGSLLGVTVDLTAGNATGDGNDLLRAWTTSSAPSSTTRSWATQAPTGCTATAATTRSTARGATTCSRAAPATTSSPGERESTPPSTNPHRPR